MTRQKADHFLLVDQNIYFWNTFEEDLRRLQIRFEAIGIIQFNGNITLLDEMHQKDTTI